MEEMEDVKEQLEKLGVVVVDKPMQTHKYQNSKKYEYKTTTPKVVLEMYKKLNIFDIENYDDRAIMIIKYFSSKKYRLKTAMKYYEFVRRDGVIGDSPIYLNKRIFDKIKPPQERVPEIGKFKKCIEYFHELVKKGIDMKYEYSDYQSIEIREVNLAFTILFIYSTSSSNSIE